MKNKEFFKGKKITIVGLARSGFACADLLSDLGADVSVTDNQDNSSTRGFASRLSTKKIKIELGRHSESIVSGSDMVVISPGVTDDSPAVVAAKSNKIPVVSEIEIGYMLCPARIIAVTGSNGKTTVTTLIGKIIEASGKRAFVCGNIGNPFCGEIGKIREQDFVSLEVSSFQLENIRQFKPYIGLILNLSKNHLDRYPGMEEYIAAKKRLFLNQDEADFLVLNKEDMPSAGFSGEARSKTIFFERSPGKTSNQAAVLACAGILGIDKELCMKVFREFKGIEHRFEFVAEIDKVRFINDSKATTVESCKMALENLSCPVILIAGGRHKGVDYSLLLPEARKKVKEVVLIGEAGKNIRQSFEGELVLNEAQSMDDAVRYAFKKAKPGDCVLLSPMCSSFDMFSNYEERGRVFKQAVLNLSR